MLHQIFADITSHMSPGLCPPAPRDLHLCSRCGSPLTLEMEFDGDEAVCVDCRAERALS